MLLRMREAIGFLFLSLTACSHGGAADGADLATAATADLATAADLAGAPDLAAAPDLSTCVTTFVCDAVTAEHGCGVTTAAGQRYPDKGAPYCPNRADTWNGCSCDLLRCTSPGPLCSGSYQAVFNETLIAGCNGKVGQLDGTCAALLNQVLAQPGGAKLGEQQLLNVSMTFGAADYPLAFQLDAPAPVRIVVKQACWFEDVSGVGNAGRSLVSSVRVAPR